MENVVEMKPKAPKTVEIADVKVDGIEVILATLENLMNFQEHLEKGIRLTTDALAQVQSQVRSLEKEVNALKRKRPAILTPSGERAN